MTRSARAPGVALALWPALVLGQVDCTNPDDLCTGDPCVIPAVEVVSPCVADFGARTVVVGGRLRVRDFPQTHQGQKNAGDGPQ